MSERSPTPEPVAEGDAESDGLRIRYRLYGSGYPLVLVHGWGADTLSNWVETGWIAALAPLRQIIALDVRGHGDSDKPQAGDVYSYAALSRDVLAVMDALGIERADYLGYSMGAFMGAWLLGHESRGFEPWCWVVSATKPRRVRRRGRALRRR